MLTSEVGRLLLDLLLLVTGCTVAHARGDPRPRPPGRRRADPGPGGRGAVPGAHARNALPALRRLGRTVPVRHRTNRRGRSTQRGSCRALEQLITALHSGGVTRMSKTTPAASRADPGLLPASSRSATGAHAAGSARCRPRTTTSCNAGRRPGAGPAVGHRHHRASHRGREGVLLRSDRRLLADDRGLVDRRSHAHRTRRRRPADGHLATPTRPRIDPAFRPRGSTRPGCSGTDRARPDCSGRWAGSPPAWTTP